MSTKGASNHYGNARGGKPGHVTKHIGFAWAKGFNKSTVYNHFNRHGQQMGCESIASYEAHAVKFANTIDRQNYISYKDKRGTTYKYDTRDNTFAIITKKGVVITYFKPKEGKTYYENIVKGLKEYGKKYI